jgi:hypothetical protein
MALTPHSTRLRAVVRLTALLVVLVLAASACSGGGKKKTTSTTVKKTTTTTTPGPPAPLTGVPQSDTSKLSRGALMVKVDNTPKGVAVQEGIDKADLVFVEQTEQGTTRLAAVFQSQDTTVGPVRSARSSDIDVAGLLNRPLFAYSGANGGVLRQVRSGPLVDVGIDARGVTPIYQRNQRGSASNLYRYFLPTADVYDARGKEAGTPPPLFQYLAKGETPPGDAVKGARVGYGGGAATVVEYQWNGTNGWDRTQNGVPHVMANNKQRLSPANVVILITPYRDSGFRDVVGAASPQAVLQGSGEAWFLTQGKLLQGTWSRPGPVGPFTFTGAFGLPMKLTPGQTFIELAPGRGSATVLP